MKPLMQPSIDSGASPDPRTQAWLSIVLVLAAVLRLNVPFYPLTYDEYSTLFRIQSESGFWEAVAGDAHPFLHHGLVWLLGYHVCKALFLCLGVTCVYLTYVLGKRLFHSGVGLIAAATCTVVQPMVMHSQIVRPYVLGGCLVLALGVALLGVVAGKRRSMIWASIWLALAMLSHYFAGLTAVGLGLAFWAMYPGRFPALLRTAGLAFVWFSPHVVLTLAQFAHGDLASVFSRPTLAFIPKHLAYSFNYSAPLVTVVLVGFLLSIRHMPWRRSASMGFAFAFPLTVGMAYSIWVGPVLQHRVLVFGLPFLLLALTAGAPRSSVKHGWMAGLMLLLGSVALLMNRQHVRTMNRREFLAVAEAAEHTAGPCLISFRPDIYRDILRRHISRSADGNKLNIDSTMALLDVRMFLDQPVQDWYSDSALFGFTGHYDRPPPEALGLMVERYPQLGSWMGFHNGAWYRFGKANEANKAIAGRCLFANRWDFSDRQAFGASVGFHLDSLPGWLLVSGRVKSADAICDARLVCEVFSKGHRVHYTGQSTDSFRLPWDTAWRVHTGVFVEDIRNYAPDSVQVYWWNPNGSAFTADSLWVQAVPSNPYQYKLFDPFGPLLDFP